MNKTFLLNHNDKSYEYPLPKKYEDFIEIFKRIEINLENFDIKYENEEKEVKTINNKEDYEMFLSHRNNTIYLKEKGLFNSLVLGTKSDSSNSSSINENINSFDLEKQNLKSENEKIKKEYKLLKEENKKIKRDYELLKEENLRMRLKFERLKINCEFVKNKMKKIRDNIF
jgi:hypothetical protein